MNRLIDENSILCTINEAGKLDVYDDTYDISLIGAMGVIGGLLIAVYKFYQKPHETEKKLKKLQELHVDDMKKINEEQCLITYGLLACLKGLQEQGCNGPVTEAINRIQKHLNKQAHDMEE